MMQKQDNRLTYGINELAVALGVNSGTVRLEIARNRLKATRFGRRVLVRVSELERYLAQGEHAR